MATPVEAPKLGNTVDELLISKWRKHAGDEVSAGDVLAEVETDKATFEISAPAGGVLLAVFFSEGALVPVYTHLCVIGRSGESVEEFRPASGPQSKATEAAATESAPSSGTVPAAKTGQGSVPSAPPDREQVLSPRARRFAEERRFYPAGVTGSGPGGRVLEEDLRSLYHASPRVSSAARARMAEGLEAPAEGSGVGGMVLSSDLVPTPERLSGIRGTIARRLRESLSSTAQYTLNSSANAAGLLAMRARVKASTQLPDITIGDLVAFAAIKALLDFPDINAELRDGIIVKHSEVHLGFACDTPRGLMVPVVRNAHLLSAGDLSQEMKRLADAAVQGRILPDELSRATFTVSNLGGLGIESFTPVLNPPQVAILGVDSIQLKPVRREGGVEFIDSIGFSLTCDHQVIDGAPGARFLKVLKEKIENVESLCTI